MGRWLSPDWSKNVQAIPYADFTHPQTLNLYQYMQNNPLGKADPDGHCVPFCGWLVDAVSTKVSTYLASHPEVAKAIEKVGDSMGIKVTFGGVARYKDGNANIGVAGGVTTEARFDGTGKSALQGTLAGSVSGAGAQLNGTATFEKNGSLVNPLDNLGGNTKLTGSNRLGDNTNSSSAIGDDGRVALGVGGSVIGANIGPVQVGVQAGVQATADSGAVMDAGAAVTSAVITDTKQYVQDLKESSTCTGTTCAIPH